MPTIAVVIPAFNRVDTIGRAVDSALAQRHPADEVIVVDDGSTDATAAIVAAYAPRVKLVRRRHAGVAAARNSGVGSTVCDFVAFLDSDDVWDDDHLSRMHDAIADTHGDAWLYFSDLRLAPLHGGTTSWRLSSFTIDRPHELRYDGKRWVLLPRQPMMISAAVFRRDEYIAVGGSEPALERRGDTHLFFKVGLAGPVCAVAGEAGEAKDDAHNSLTRTLSGDSDVYWNCTTWLYADLLRREDLSADEREELRRSLAHGYLALARRAGARPPAIPHLLRALRQDPALVMRRARSFVAATRA